MASWLPGRNARALAPAAALLALAPAACSLSVWSTERQCETDADCARRGAKFEGTTCAGGTCVAAPEVGEVDPVWGCLSGGRAGEPAPAPATVRVTFHGVRLAVTEPLVGASVRPCLINDVACSRPVAPAQLTDAEGLATFEVPAGFDGFFEGLRDDVRPIMLFPGTLTGDVRLPPVGGVTEEESTFLEAFAEGSVGPEDFRPGVAILYVNDCGGRPAAGVKFAVEGDGKVVPFILVQGAPNTSAPETDADGRGGFFSLPENGYVLFHADRAATGERVGTANVFMRENAITYARLGPAP